MQGFRGEATLRGCVRGGTLEGGPKTEHRPQTPALLHWGFDDASQLDLEVSEFEKPLCLPLAKTRLYWKYDS